MAMDKKTKKVLGTGAVIATVAGVAIIAAPALGLGSTGNASSGGGGGSLGGFADPIDYGDTGEDIVSFEDLLAMIPWQPEAEPSLLDTPPIYPEPEPQIKTPGFWSSLLNPETTEKATKAALTTARMMPFFMAAPSVRIAASGALVGAGLGINAIDSVRDFVNRDKRQSLPGSIGKGIGSPPAAGTTTKSSGNSGNGIAKKKGGSGYGSARVVETVKTIIKKDDNKPGSGLGLGSIGGGFGGGFGGAR